MVWCIYEHLLMGRDQLWALLLWVPVKVDGGEVQQEPRGAGCGVGCGG